jgi:hypothetical protein
MLRLLMAICVLCSLAACSNQANKSIRIEAGSDKTLVLMGIRMIENQSGSFQFIRYDPVKKMSTNESKTINFRSEKLFNAPGYAVQAFDLPEGHWVLAKTFTSRHAYNKQETYLNAGTLAFEAKPGEIIHIGDYEVGFNSRLHGDMRPVTTNKFLAENKLSEYKNAQGEIRFDAAYGVSFGCAKRTNLLGQKVGCDPINIEKNSNAS